MLVFLGAPTLSINTLGRTTITIIGLIKKLTIECLNAECHISNVNAKCRYAERRCAECRSAIFYDRETFFQQAVIKFL